MTLSPYDWSDWIARWHAYCGVRATLVVFRRWWSPTVSEPRGDN